MKIDTITTTEARLIMPFLPDSEEAENSGIMFTAFNLPDEAGEGDGVALDDPSACAMWFQLCIKELDFSKSLLVDIHSFLNIVKTMQEYGVCTDGFSIKYDKSDNRFVISKEYALIKEPFIRVKKGGEA